MEGPHCYEIAGKGECSVPGLIALSPLADTDLAVGLADTDKI